MPGIPRAVSSDSGTGVWIKGRVTKKLNGISSGDPGRKEHRVTISPQGSVDKVKGVDSLFPEQQKAAAMGGPVRPRMDASPNE